MIDKLILEGEMEQALSHLDSVYVPITIATLKPVASSDDQVDFFLQLLVERIENKSNIWKYIVRMKSI